MIKVVLEGIEFFAYHGFYPEEQILGTRFLVDVAVIFKQQGDLRHDQMANMVDYEVLYNIVKTEMINPRKLIETVVKAILDNIVVQFPFINHGEVTLKKISPALSGPVKNSAVTISYQKA